MTECPLWVADSTGGCNTESCLGSGSVADEVSDPVRGKVRVFFRIREKAHYSAYFPEKEK